MAGTKISALTADTPQSTDEVAVRRGSANFRVTLDGITTLGLGSAQGLVDAGIASHAASTTGVHGADTGTKIAIIHGGGQNIFVQETSPTAEFAGDLWIDTSGS